jgi:hypothetical protein
MMLLVSIAIGCQTTNVGPVTHRTRVGGVVAGSLVVVEATDARRPVSPSGLEVTQITRRHTCDAPALPLVAGLLLGVATAPVSYGVERALPRYDGGALAVPAVMGTVAFAAVIGGLIWLDHCDALSRAEGEVVTAAPPSPVVVEHGGYRPERLVIDHRQAQVRVTQAPAWRVAGPEGTLDVYASPRLDEHVSAEAGAALARRAAERWARSPARGPGVVTRGDPTMAPPERRLELDLEPGVPTCRVSIRREGEPITKPTRTATTACDPPSATAALERLIDRWTP